MEGIIFDGKMFVNARVGREQDKDLGTCGFAVSSEAPSSLIAVGTLKELKIPQKSTGSLVVLWVEGRKQKFKIVEEDNVLGFDFLQDHGVLVSCNFRPDSCKC